MLLISGKLSDCESDDKNSDFSDDNSKNMKLDLVDNHKVLSHSFALWRYYHHQNRNNLFIFDDLTYLLDCNGLLTGEERRVFCLCWCFWLWFV